MHVDFSAYTWRYRLLAADRLAQPWIDGGNALGIDDPPGRVFPFSIKANPRVARRPFLMENVAGLTTTSMQAIRCLIQSYRT